MKTPAPSPTGTNRAGVFLQGSAERAVRNGRALIGAAYDQKFGLARDQAEYQPKSLDEHLANETIKQIKDALTKEGFDKKIIVAVIRSLCGADPEGALSGFDPEMTDDEDDKDTSKPDQSSSTQAVAGDDPPDFAGRPNKAGQPSPSKGSVTQDRRPNWLRSVDDNAQGKALERAKKNMARIGHCW
jgi:hypothetical protein